MAKSGLNVSPTVPSSFSPRMLIEAMDLMNPLWWRSQRGCHWSFLMGGLLPTNWNKLYNMAMNTLMAFKNIAPSECLFVKVGVQIITARMWLPLHAGWKFTWPVHCCGWTMFCVLWILQLTILLLIHKQCSNLLYVFLFKRMYDNQKVEIQYTIPWQKRKSVNSWGKVAWNFYPKVASKM